MEIKVGQYWIDTRDLNYPEVKSFHGAWVLEVVPHQVLPHQVKIQFIYYKDRSVYDYEEIWWSVQSFLKYMKLCESSTIRAILEKYED